MSGGSKYFIGARDRNRTGDLPLIRRSRLDDGSVYKTAALPLSYPGVLMHGGRADAHPAREARGDMRKVRYLAIWKGYQKEASC